ncbi:MKI67 FHA domain-interacting nucleolar phosphoprotein [Babesia sp. Xinjiang]|uniref:MKI67 FHA domain-interacting nucleolar phosphoprotein n=1 Tax=Babesia sp. Xinjiang TaxID=462227 RepID=UPI000A2181A9|nr:MKI67 FHA domain-interacting nucleolar phosphoprotein [Babesia sp. Xinjiang]ORM39840.1 MKI67 FHA domain-interacting nucleolar phosphoprotein [Babesia sp. Xinjiang]
MDDNEEVKSDVIYVGNLPKTLTESHIRTYFNQFGKVVKIRLMISKKTGNSRGYCYVQFENHEIAAIAADAMNNYFIDGRVLKVHVKEKGEHMRKIFRKGKPILPRKRQLVLRAARAEASLKSAEDDVRQLLEGKEKNNETDSSSKEQLKARLQSAIEKMEAKQRKLGTDIYSATIEKYNQALQLLQTTDK